MKGSPSAGETAAMETILAFLAPRDDSAPADAVIAFGHFDLRIPRAAAELYRCGLARWMVCTGGVGAGSADLGMPEARAFHAEIRRHHSDVPDEHIIVEDRSTNTAENLRFTQQLLSERGLPLDLSDPAQRFLLVANPYRQRRVWLTCRKLFPRTGFLNSPPDWRVASESALFAEKGEDLRQHLLGELDRLETYPSRGWIEACPVPASVQEAKAHLQRG